MTKSELKQWAEESKVIAGTNFRNELLSKIDQLDEPEPETIPFTWPIPAGYEPVTRDGRKVEQLVRFEGISKDVEVFRGVVDNGILSWYANGGYLFEEEDKADLFLRKTAPEMVEAWYYIKAGQRGVSLSSFVADEYRSHGYKVDKITFPKPKP